MHISLLLTLEVSIIFFRTPLPPLFLRPPPPYYLGLDSACLSTLQVLMTHLSQDNLGSGRKLNINYSFKLFLGLIIRIGEETMESYYSLN